MAKEKVILGAYGTAGNCNAIVEKIIEPKTGGIFCQLKGCSYAYKGYPDTKITDAIEPPKRIILSISRLLEIPLVKIFLIIVFLLPRRVLLRLCDIGMEMLYPPIEKHLKEPKKYCISVWEIYHISEIMIPKNGRIRAIIVKLRDFVCMVLEYDKAYGWRLQDVLPLLDIEALKRNPVKELQRLLDILSTRETSQVMKDKWKRIKKMLWFLRFNKKVSNWIVEFLSQINLENIKLDEADWYFVLRYESYNFRNMSFEARFKEQVRIDKEKHHHIPNLVIPK